MEKKSPFFGKSFSFFLFQNFESISDGKGNILDDVETCRTFTWVVTPFKESTNPKCNGVNVKDRVDRVE